MKLSPNGAWGGVEAEKLGNILIKGSNFEPGAICWLLWSFIDNGANPLIELAHCFCKYLESRSSSMGAVPCAPRGYATVSA